MMYEHFTDSTRKVLQLACHEALRFNYDGIYTEYILLGLVKADPGVAVYVFKKLKVELRTIRNEVEKLLQVGPNIVRLCSPNDNPDYIRGRKILEFVMQEARILNHNFVYDIHLLLGLFHVHDGIAAQVLTKLGLTLEAVRLETINILGIGIEKTTDAKTSEPPAALSLTEKLDLEIEALGLRKELALGRQDFDLAALLQDLANQLRKKRETVD